MELWRCERHLSLRNRCREFSNLLSYQHGPLNLRRGCPGIAGSALTIVGTCRKSSNQPCLRNTNYSAFAFTKTNSASSFPAKLGNGTCTTFLNSPLSLSIHAPIV